MSIYNVRLLLAFAFLLIIIGNEIVAGQETKIKAQEQPTVIKAIAPILIPFVYGKAAVNEVTIQVKINNEGKVTSTQIITASLFKDKYLEETARQWLFESSLNKEERTAEIKFIMRIMPKGTDMFELGTVYTYPAQLEVRHAFVEPRIETLPSEVQSIPQNKKTPQTRAKRKRN
jgi:hypothetical protein